MTKRHPRRRPAEDAPCETAGEHTSSTPLLPSPVDEPPVDELDPVWRALANPWRRYLLDLIRSAPRTTGELATACAGLSRFAVMQHLDVLTEAKLVVARRRGRQRWNHLNPVPIQRIHERWVRRFEGHWAEALVGLKRTLEERNDGAGTSSAAAG